MKRRLTAALFAFLMPLALVCGAPPASASDEAALSGAETWLADPGTILDAGEIDLAAFRWIARPLVIFADTPADPAFTRQLDLIQARMDELVARDVVVVTDTDPDARSPLREKLRPRGFMLVLVGKDGGVKLRKPFPWDVREITRSIDKMPIRQQELRDRRDMGH